MYSTFIKSEPQSHLKLGEKSNTSFDQLISDMGTCADCNLCETATQDVPPLWLGNLYDIDLMLIGEAPNIDEDMYGEPFIGQSGRLLQSILQEIGLINNIYITNVVKHKPPSNRKPTQMEQDLCSSLFLSKEINMVNPKHIVCLGRVPAEHLLRQSRNSLFGTLRGKTFTLGGEGTVWKNSTPVTCTWNLAHVLRQPDKKSELVNDLKTARQHINRI